MTLRLVDSAELESAFTHRATAYDTAAFCALNAWKVDELEQVAFGHDLALTFGISDCEAASPFSAPFACWRSRKREVSAGALADAVAALTADYRKEDNIRLTLPPEFYTPGLIAPTIAALTKAGWVQTVEYNYHYDCRRLMGDITAESLLAATARNKLRHSEAAGLRTERLAPNPANIERAYAIIAANRAERGYPLRMTLEQVKATTAIIPSRFYVTGTDSTDMAAAMVYFVAPRIAQVIYWGHLGAHSHSAPMTRLAVDLFTDLANEVDFIDLGPASQDGVPDINLCRFKADLGGIPSTRFTFMRETVKPLQS